ncbi:hypothetical protein H6P81_003571 [Aristolochia fimbriata]|uniref:Water stress and hypersensitive response domain-containing protein n=1 Tax=Aristolochia fimbriata TaxID=158543 RepID=A0AAV7FH55_ARIFI|nr:hypothetical protein H6P81_003571 [Aristolochia fimbriata]
MNWSWFSALVGAACTSATAAVMTAKPRSPRFHLISISLASFNLHLPLLDADFVLTLHVTNPNVVPISYGPSVVSIVYDGSVLGTAKMEPGYQAAKSCTVVHLRARLHSVELGQHAVRFLSDVAWREMVLSAAVEIGGTAKLLWWGHRFTTRLDGRVKVDPLFLEAIEQENRLGLGF